MCFGLVSSKFVALEYQELEFVFWWPQPNGLSSILWVAMNAPFFSILSPLISHFEHGHFTLAYTILDLEDFSSSHEFELWMITCKFQVSKSQNLQVRALNLSSGVKGA